MAERPEQVLPQQRIAARAGLEEMRAEMTVQQQQDASGCHAGQREEQQEGGNQLSSR